MSENATKATKEPKQKSPPKEKLAARGKGASAPAESREASPTDQTETTRGLAPTPRLKDFYVKELRAKLMKDLQLKNVNQVPRLEKIVINSGVGEGTKDFKVIEDMTRDIGIITGQKPIIRRAAKDVSAFGVRAGNPIGLMVTMRNKRMYEFLDRFISLTLPRVRDFRGISPKNFDRRGNLTIGIKEHTVYPEVDIEKVHRVKGMNVTFVTSSTNDAHAKALMEGFGMPFSDGK